MRFSAKSIIYNILKGKTFYQKINNFLIILAQNIWKDDNNM